MSEEDAATPAAPTPAPVAAASEAATAPSPSGKPAYVIVDVENAAGPIGFGKERRDGLLPINESENNAAEYWREVTSGRVAGQSHPWLVVMYGTPGSGKSRALDALCEDKGWTEGDFVHLDPDALRMYSAEYRSCLSGAYAAKLPSVQAEFGDRLVPTVWRSSDGRFSEDGYTIDGKFAALANSAIRSQGIIRKAMLWPHKQGPEMCDALTDQAYKLGYNIVYDTMGNEPNRFLRDLMGRARSQHEYKVIVCGCYAPWEAVKQRSAARAEREGRHVAEDFTYKEHAAMWPRAVAGEVPDGAIDTTHHDKFEVELRPGDERYLFDNSGDKPVKARHDVHV